MTGDIIAGSILILAAALFSWKRRLGLEKEFLTSVVRAVVQLTILGSVIHLVFAIENFALVALLLTVMVLIAGYTAAKRAGDSVPGAFKSASLSIGVEVFLSLSLLLVVKVIEPSPIYLVPLGGIVIGNAMKAVSISFDLVVRQFREKVENIEAALVLGATPVQATEQICRNSVRTALIPLIDTLKIVGLIQIPGAMTGMLLAGESPLDAVRLQIMILLMLVFSGVIASATAAGLARRKLFTPDYQLVHQVAEEA